MKTKKDILLENQAAYPNAAARAVNSAGLCTYYNKETGKKCVIGRVAMMPELLPEGCLMLREEPKKWMINYQCEWDDTLLLPEYRGHEPQFWADLQGWHDTQDHFSDEGITPDGEDHFNSLWKKWTSI